MPARGKPLASKIPATTATTALKLRSTWKINKTLTIWNNLFFLLKDMCLEVRIKKSELSIAGPSGVPPSSLGKLGTSEGQADLAGVVKGGSVPP